MDGHKLAYCGIHGGLVLPQAGKKGLGHNKKRAFALFSLHLKHCISL